MLGYPVLKLTSWMPQISIFNDLNILAKCWHSAYLLDDNDPLILIPYISSILVLLQRGISFPYVLYNSNIFFGSVSGEGLPRLISWGFVDAAVGGLLWRIF